MRRADLLTALLGAEVRRRIRCLGHEEGNPQVGWVVWGRARGQVAQCREVLSHGTRNPGPRCRHPIDKLRA